MLTFVMGTGRCGSTLVAELVARHPDVGFVSNVDDKFALLNLKGRWNNALFNRSGERDPSLRPFRNRRRPLERGRLRVAPSEGWLALERQISPIFPRSCRDLTASDAMPWLTRRVQDFFTSRQEAQRKPVFMHHMTGWPRAGLLLEAFPQARFVNVIRDGRAVANSWLQMGWWDGYEGPDNWYLGPLPPRERELWEASGRDFVVLAALGWHLLMQSFEEARAGVSADQWLDLRYEDLVAAPRESAGRLLEFVGLDWSADYEAGFARHTFQASRGAAWRRDLGAEQVRKVEQAVGPTLARYGYQLTEGRPDPVPSTSDGLPPLVPLGELATHS